MAKAKKRVAAKTKRSSRTKGKVMSQSQIVTELAEATDLSRKEVKHFLESLTVLAYKEAKSNEKGFRLPGFGKLIVVKRKARMGRNPATGEQIRISARTALKFRIAKAAKVGVLGPNMGKRKTRKK